MIPSKKILNCTAMSVASLAVLAGTAFSRDLYWSEGKKIFASDIDGGNIAEIFDGETSTPVMESYIVDIDATENHIYWTGHGGGDVWRAGRDGSNPEQIVSDTNASVHFLDIDESAQTLRFSDFGGRILQTDLDGGNIQTIFNDNRITGLAGFTAHPNPGSYDAVLAVRSGSAHLFHLIMDEWGGWLDSQVQLEGGNGNYGMVYVPGTDTIYYTNYNEHTLRSYNLTTEEHELLRTPGISNPLDIELSPSGTHLVFVERGRGISGYDLTTGGYELLVEAPNAHFGVAVTVDPGTLEIPPPPADGEVLFFTDFEEDAPGGLPAVGWRSVAGPDTGTMEVVADSENVFGFGSDNQFFRVESADGIEMYTEHFREPVEVVTFSFDFIGRFHEGDGERWLNVFFRAGNNNARTHITSFVLSSRTVRGSGKLYGENEIPLRVETIMNNSAEAVFYENPADGRTEELPSKRAALWIYDYATQIWHPLEKGYTYESTVTETGALIDGIRLSMDGRTPPSGRSLDLDNLKATVGAHLSDLEGSLPVIRVPEEPILIAHDDFEQYDGPLQITDVSDYRGPFTMNRVASNGTVHIVRDEQNRFGRGTDNLVMYWDKAVGTQIDLPIGTLNTGVATVAFDMYHEGNYETAVASGTNRLGARFHAQSFATTAVTGGIVNNFGFEANADQGDYYVRGLGNRRIHPHYVQRWVVVRNNTRDPITYDSPRGPIELNASRSHVWLNGFLFNEEYSFGDVQVEQAIHGFRFDAFNSWTAYIDNLRVWEGAIVPDTDIQRDTEPAERDLLVYEGFDYAEGSLNGLDGGIGWADAYTAQDGFGSATVTAPGLDWNGLPVEGNRLVAAGPNEVRDFRMIDIEGIHSSMLNELSGYTHIGPQGGSVWISVLGQGNPDQTETFWGLSLYRNTSATTGEVLFLGKGSGDTEEDGWRFTGGEGSSTEGIIRTEKSLTDKHFWAIRIDYRDNGNQVAHLFHNPDPTGPAPTVPLLSRETRVGSFGFDRVRIAGNGAGFAIDEIRIGSSWTAVAPLGDDTPPSQDGFAGWLDLHFPGETDPAIVSPEADPDGDGVPNLLEYALGMNPHEASREGLPVLQVEILDVDGVEDAYLTLTGTLTDSINDLDFAVEVGDELGNWETGRGVLVRATPNGDGTTTYTFRDEEPVTVSDRRFMRLNVSFLDN